MRSRNSFLTLSMSLLLAAFVMMTTMAIAQDAKPAAPAASKVSANPVTKNADSTAAGQTGAAKPAVKPAAKKKSIGFSVANIDKSVDPCDDFYHFACGNWIKKNPIPSDQVRWGRFNQLAEANRDILHDLLEKAKVKSPTRTKIQAEYGDFYGACMDETTINKKGAEPLKSYFDKVDAVKTMADLFRLMGEGRSSGMPSFFGFGGGPDI